MINKKIYLILVVLIISSIFVFSQEFDELKLKQPDKAADSLLQEETLNLEKAEDLLSQEETKEVKALSPEKKKELGEKYFSERLELSKEQSFNINKEAKYELTEVNGKKILRTESIEVEINKLKSLSSNPNIKGFEITKEGLLEIKQKEANPFKISNLGSIGVGEEGKTVFFHAKEEGKVKVDFGDGVPIEGKIVSFTRIAAGTRVVVTSAADLTGEFKIKSGDEMFTIQPTSLRKPKAPKVLVDAQVIVEKDNQERVSKIYTLQGPDGFKGITPEGLKFNSQAGSLSLDYKDGFGFNFEGKGSIEYFGFKGDSSIDGKIKGKSVGEDVIIETENTKVSYDWEDAEGEPHKYDVKDDEGEYSYIISPNIDKYKDLAVNGLVIDVDNPNKIWQLGDLRYEEGETESVTKGGKTKVVEEDNKVDITPESTEESTESLWRDPDGFYLQTNGKGEFYITRNILREIVKPEAISKVYEIGPKGRSLFLRRTSGGYEIHDPRKPSPRTLIHKEKVDFTNEEQYRKFMEKLIKPRWR